ncbi:hypothetical protein HPP92_008187 [Vanilla planifolia]|uniref:Uncharacterized protein n=1 Tax=Vanilla planifolia TaxID=51239 RepID=A0A835RHY0_VANPL|nr:hypothetical protein HPP92_008187 [Vanilla planifolia]
MPFGEIKLEEAAVLHYTYTKFSDLTSRRDRCGCKPTKNDVKRCFMLDFDRDAFIIASTASEEEMLQWFRERVVWTNKQLNLKLLRKGILTRIYAPMVIIQGLRESGVFSSAIATAKKHQQDVLASTKKNHKQNSAMAATSLDGKNARTISAAWADESLVLHRKIMLEIPETWHSAVPPLSPPAPEKMNSSFD